jgi:hypothetical protein
MVVLMDIKDGTGQISRQGINFAAEVLGTTAFVRGEQFRNPAVRRLSSIRIDDDLATVRGVESPARSAGLVFRARVMSTSPVVRGAP